MSHASYVSPFSWRYGRAELRALLSENERRRLWRAVWVALAESQVRSGLVSPAEAADIRAHAGDVDIDAALAIEREIGHDLMAEIRVFAAQAQVGGGKIHLGATSMDVEDTVEAYRLRRALALVGESVGALLRAFGVQIARYAEHVCMGYTHLQPAEPTTVGYRLAVWAQDLLLDEAQLRFAYDELKTKGIRGAVGNVGFLRTPATWLGPLGAGSGKRRPRRVRSRSSRGQHADVSAQTGLPRALDARRTRCVAFEVCSRRAHSVVAGFRRTLRAVRLEAGRQFGHAVQTQSRDERANRLAGATAAGLRRRRLAERRHQLLGTHARRQCESAHDFT